MNNEEETKNSEQTSVDRRKFLQIAASTAAMVGSSTAMSAQQATPPRTDTAANDARALPPVRAGSDFMLDVIKSLGFEYVAAN